MSCQRAKETNFKDDKHILMWWCWLFGNIIITHQTHLLRLRWETCWTYKVPCSPKFLYPTWKRINVIAVYCDKMNKFSIFGFKKMVFGRFLPQCFDFTRGMFVTTMSWEKEVMNKQMWNAPVEKICCLCKQWLKIHCLPSRGTWNLLPFLTKNCSVTQCSFTSCCHFCNLCQLW